VLVPDVQLLDVFWLLVLELDIRAKLYQALIFHQLWIVNVSKVDDECLGSCGLVHAHSFESFASTHPHIVSVGLVAGDSSFKSWFLTVSQCQDLEESLQTYIGKRYVSAGTSFREGLIGWMVQTFTKD